MYTPRQCGVKYDPPSLILYYVINATGKVHRRSMPLRDFSIHSNLDETVEKLKSGRHKHYLEKISSEQIHRLLSKIQEQLPPENNNKVLQNVQDEDLNKLSDKELNKRKAEMDHVFEEHRVKPGDEGFEYNVEVEFEGGKYISGWDSDDGDYSDPEF
ncbi:centrosomal protein of 19 kDa-like [Xenia sp. Carnegie-2017]|uniref:centrosomal protein of 19 kDa-like n=1 Tax=Xenia sp. Carnegie-2017 TaxID=2897299 RepID=UPI001F044449|nr:centrosomal protein of 19 kDa-like [Xenia sp. Carnegie-2017]